MTMKLEHSSRLKVKRTNQLVSPWLAAFFKLFFSCFRYLLGTVWQCPAHMGQRPGAMAHWAKQLRTQTRDTSLGPAVPGLWAPALACQAGCGSGCAASSPRPHTDTQPLSASAQPLSSQSHSHSVLAGLRWCQDRCHRPPPRPTRNLLSPITHNSISGLVLVASLLI